MRKTAEIGETFALVVFFPSFKMTAQDLSVAQIQNSIKEVLLVCHTEIYLLLCYASKYQYSLFYNDNVMHLLHEIRY